MSKLPNTRIYYAQNREDLILEAFFPDVKKGFYVDVGACHPDVASVTKRFYLNGWTGINIEPQTNLFELFEAERENDLNLNLGISDKDSELILRSYINDQGRSTISPNIQGVYEKHSGDSTEQFVDIKITVVTLAEVFTRYNVNTIHFLKVDVEGHEFEVLLGNDWSQFRPEVICIEADHVVRDWRRLLKKNEYTLIFFDGLNEYYADSRTDRGSKFNYINHVVVGLKGGVASDDFEKITEAQKLIDQTEKEIATLRSEQQSIKAMLRRVVKLSPSRIRNRVKTL